MPWTTLLNLAVHYEKYSEALTVFKQLLDERKHPIDCRLWSLKDSTPAQNALDPLLKSELVILPFVLNSSVKREYISVSDVFNNNLGNKNV